MQARARRLEPTARLRVVVSADQPHELGHGVAVVPRRAEGVLGDQPARREDDDVRDGGAGVVGGAGEDCVDGRVGVVEGDGADGVEAAQVVFVGVVVAVPGDDVEGGVALARGEEGVVELAVEPVFAALFLVVEGGHGRLEVSGVGEAVGADGAQFGELVVALVELADIASYGAVGEGDAVSMEISCLYTEQEVDRT